MQFRPAEIENTLIREIGKVSQISLILKIITSRQINTAFYAF